MLNVKDNYQKTLKSLQDALAIKNVNALPKIEKVTLNVGIGPIRSNKDQVEYVKNTLKTITGQKPTARKAKKAIAGFKLREGEEIGLMVTLRGQRMFDFLNRLVNIYLPRIRDFKGFSDKSFDHQGNFSIGFRDIVPFAEVSGYSTDKPFGVSVTFTISKSSREKSAQLLTLLGFPMKKG